MRGPVSSTSDRGATVLMAESGLRMLGVSGRAHPRRRKGPAHIALSHLHVMSTDGMSSCQIFVGDFADDFAWNAHDDRSGRDPTLFGHDRPGCDQALGSDFASRKQT